MRAPPASTPAQEIARELAVIAADVVVRLRERRPRVHCITNAVAQNFTANMLLAAGAIPSMTIAPEEVSEFVTRADALLINLGTFDAERRTAADLAIAAAQAKGMPWVLDPVFVERSTPRTVFARALAARRPTAVRLNSAEFIALTGDEPGMETVMRHARAIGGVIGLTGETDLVCDGARLARVNNGDPLMARVTAMGCAGTALMAACLAVESDPWRGVAAGLILLGVAGELAAAKASGPGSLAVGILDALHALDRETVIAWARVS